MANYVLQEMADGMANKTQAPYPKMQMYTLFDYEQLIEQIHVHSPAFSKATIRGVLDTLGETVGSLLPLGHTVKVDGLGVFSLSLGFSDAPEDATKSTYRRVEARGVNFKVDQALLKDINRQSTFERVETDVVRPTRLQSTRAERLAKALAFIDRRGEMHLSDYAQLTGLSRSGASQELKRFTADPTSGLSTRGSHSFKVWIRKDSE